MNITEKHTRIAIMAFLMLLAIVVLGGCFKAEPTKDPNTLYTEAVETVNAQLTQNAALTPEPTGTKIPEPTQEIPPPPGPGDPTATQQQPTATSASTGDAAEWVSQDPADNSSISIGTNFQIIWTVKNTGITTWTTDYLYRFYTSDQPGVHLHVPGNDSYRLTKDVPPGEQIDLVVDAIAPNSPIKVKNTWVLTNADGVNFYPVYITINVVVQPTTTVTPAP